jgi:hypothetical protein
MLSVWVKLSKHFPLWILILSLSSSAALKQAPLARQLVSISTDDRRMVIAERSLIGQFARATSRLQLHLMEPMTLWIPKCLLWCHQQSSKRSILLNSECIFTLIAGVHPQSKTACLCHDSPSRRHPTKSFSLCISACAPSSLPPKPSSQFIEEPKAGRRWEWSRHVLGC